MDVRSLQKPLKDQYRNDPNSSKITIRAKGGQTDVPVACSIDIGRAIYKAEATRESEALVPALVPVTFCLGFGCLCADYLPDGGSRYGHTDGTH